MRFIARQGPRARAGFATFVVLLIAVAIPHAGGQTTEELQRELNGMKAEFKQLKEQIKKQEQLINKQEQLLNDLSNARPSKVAAPDGVAKAPTALAPEAAAPAAPDEQKLEERIAEDVARRMQPSLAAANKTFPSQFNPAIGFIIDNVGSYKEHERGNFEFRSGELGLSASVDPFVRGYAILNGTADGIEVEEAAIVTTSLPYNLTLKGGRFFADFGRLSKFHDHDLPFVNRPVVLDRFVEGESQGDGVEGSWLVPLPQYLTLTLGAYNKIGAENTRVDNTVPRDFSKFTYLARPATFFSLNDSNSVDVGASYAYTPKVDTFTMGDVEQLRDGKPRHLAGLDVTYRYTPLNQASYHGFVWGTEVLYNSEDFNVGDDSEPVFRRKDAFGLYSYAEAKLTRQFYPGFRFDYAQDLARAVGPTKAYSPYFTIWASEFQRIRLEYTYLDEPANHESQFYAQWTVILGSHVHGFRDR